MSLFVVNVIQCLPLHQGMVPQQQPQQQGPPPIEQHSTSLVAPDMGRAAGRDFFSNFSSEMNGIAAQTSNMFSNMFGEFLILCTVYIKNYFIDNFLY